MFELIPYVPKSIWNKGKLVGQKINGIVVTLSI
jgi:hypothetical protein